MSIFNETLVKQSKYIKYIQKDKAIISFKATYPKFSNFLYLLATIICATLIVLSLVFLQKGSLELYVAAIFIAALLILLLVTLNLFISHTFFKFSFENEQFILKLPFKETKILPLPNVEQVDITKFYSSPRRRKYLIIFWSRDGQRYFYFYNRGFVLDGDVLNKLLDNYQIPYTIHK